MAVYTFTRSPNQIQINDFIDQFPGDYNLKADDSNGLVQVKAKDFSFMANIDIDQDEVIINGDTFSGLPSELLEALYEIIFTSDNEESGETPSLASVLSEANDANGQQIKNSADPTDPQDLVTKQFYEDNLPAPFSGSYSDLSDKPSIPVLPLQFIAQIEQGGGATAPNIFNVMVNTLGGDPIFTRNGVGQYQCTLAGAFPIGKTILSVTPKQTGDFFFVETQVDSSTDSVTFLTYKLNLGGGTSDLSDGAFSGSFSNIRIEVYP